MQNKSKKRWLDIQVILASLAVTFVLGLWNVFAKGARPAASPPTPTPPDAKDKLTYAPNPTPTATLDPNAPIHLPKVHILLGGSLPAAQVVVAASSAGNEIAGSSPSNAAPPPVTTTKSSHP